MNKLLKDLTKALKKHPAVSKEEIEMVKELFKYLNIQKRHYLVIGIYENNKSWYTSEIKSYKDIPYEVWYNMKHRKNRFILIDGKLLNYNITDTQRKNLDDVIDNLKNNKNVKFTLDESTTNTLISKPE